MSTTWEHSEDIVLQTSWAICFTVMPSEAEGAPLKFVWGGLNNTATIVGCGGSSEQIKHHGHTAFVASVSVAPDKETVASGSGDGTVKIWAKGECVQTLSKHGGSAVTAVAWHPTSGKLASGGCDNAVILYSGEPGSMSQEKKYAEHEDDCNAIAWSSNGELIASGGDDGVIKVYPETTCKPRGKKLRITSVCFSPDSLQVAGGASDGTVRLFKSSGGGGRVFKHGEGPCSSVVWNSHGLWSGGWNKRLTLWTNNGKIVQSIRTGSKVFSVDATPGGGEICATTQAGKLMIWKPTKKEAGSLVKQILSVFTVDVSQFQ